MESPPKTDLPKPLPKPLSDPLLRYRRLFVCTLPPLWVAVALGLLLPNVEKVRKVAEDTQIQNNFKQIGEAIDHGHPPVDAAGAQSFNNFQQFGELDPRLFRDNAAGPQVPKDLRLFISPSDSGLPSDDATGTQIPNNLMQFRVPSDSVLPPNDAAIVQGKDDIQPMRRLHITAESATFAALFTVLFCTFFLLPRRATNAIYLRAFRNDTTTGELRATAQAALGPAFRLSGIRDPRRRWPGIIRHMFYLLFLIRYAQPKFMNLEAGRDWKARLWRSLGDVRCALIDVSELTPFVREEVELATGCLDFQRVLFIGDDSRTADQCRQAILTALGMPDVPPERFQVALWSDTAAGRAAFSNQVRAFADRVPAKPPGLNAAAFPETPSSNDPGGNAVTGESWQMFLLATLIGVAVSGVMVWTEYLTPNVGLVWYLLAAIYYTLAFLLLLQYFVVCGSLRQRLWLGGTFLFAAALSGVSVVAAFVAGGQR